MRSSRWRHAFRQTGLTRPPSPTVSFSLACQLIEIPSANAQYLSSVFSWRRFLPLLIFLWKGHNIAFLLYHLLHYPSNIVLIALPCWNTLAAIPVGCFQIIVLSSSLFLSFSFLFFFLHSRVKKWKGRLTSDQKAWIWKVYGTKSANFVVWKDVHNNNRTVELFISSL